MKAAVETYRVMGFYSPQLLFFLSKGYDVHDGRDGDSRNMRRDSREYDDWKCFEVIWFLIIIFESFLDCVSFFRVTDHFAC